MYVLVVGSLGHDPVGQYGTSLVSLGVTWVTPYVARM